jgi:tetratricopeptide (TPR) repeat protein
MCAGVGAVHFHQGEFVEAVRSYKRAVRIDANIAEYHCEPAQVSLTEGYIRQAIEQLKHAKELAPDNPGILLALGDAYLAEERYSSTIKEYRELLRLNPTWRLLVHI